MPHDDDETRRAGLPGNRGQIQNRPSGRREDRSADPYRRFGQMGTDPDATVSPSDPDRDQGFDGVDSEPEVSQNTVGTQSLRPLLPLGMSGNQTRSRGHRRLVRSGIEHRVRDGEDSVPTKTPKHG